MEKLVVERPFLWEYLTEAKKPIVLYGMGRGADRIIDACDKRDIPINAVFASDDFVRGQTYRGNLVMPYEEAKERYGDMIILVAFGTHDPQVLSRIRELGKEQELYQPCLDFVSGTPYTQVLFDVQSDGLRNAYEMLADDLSRKTFKNILNFKITGDPQYLYDCEVPRDKTIYTDLLRLTNHEMVVDAGAYDGDTVNELYDAVGGWKFLMAFEPDPHNFRKLEQNTRQYKGIRCVNSAIGAMNGWIDFAIAEGRQSHVSEDGKPVHLYSIDKMAPSATYIKMDVEGSELQGLHGAQNVIRDNSPRLNIAAYHHHEDLFEIPLYVSSMNKKYDVYLRHFPCLPDWDTCYFFV